MHDINIPLNKEEASYLADILSKSPWAETNRVKSLVILGRLSTLIERADNTIRMFFDGSGRIPAYSVYLPKP